MVIIVVGVVITTNTITILVQRKGLYRWGQHK
jgi:hypothetical protein